MVLTWRCPQCNLAVPMKPDHFPIHCKPSCGFHETFDEFRIRITSPEPWAVPSKFQRHMRNFGIGDLVAMAITPWIPFIDARPWLLELLKRWGVIDEKAKDCPKCKVRQKALNEYCRCRWWCHWGIKPIAAAVWWWRLVRARRNAESAHHHAHQAGIR